ncbi:MAG: 8-amino-7-oxononanoate synthase, partial [Elusimicrobia bacterium]|nr:8-amino-7-oxononanoate synthase [Elusimicrobiota bacterium]
ALRRALERGLPAGSGGSRLLRGNHAEHEALESEAARFFGAESALFFGSGYAANLALFSALPSRRSAVVLDERIHASVKEGVRASFARKYAARHNDPQSFEDALRRARRDGARELLVAVESLYSMDGDLAPLSELVELSRRHDAVLVVDEAHATGVLGPRGRGLMEGRLGERHVALHGCGKALGSAGALVVGPAVVKEYMVNAARPFLYSTAPPPAWAVVARRALGLVDEEPWRRERLIALCRLARGLLPGAAGTPIAPVPVGSEAAALEASRALGDRGFDVRAIRPPTVPEGSCRLRVSLNADRSEAELRALAGALAEVLARGD